MLPNRLDARGMPSNRLELCGDCVAHITRSHCRQRKERAHPYRQPQAVVKVVEIDLGHEKLPGAWKLQIAICKQVREDLLVFHSMNGTPIQSPIMRSKVVRRSSFVVIPL
jgi:hypothetical protein